jgi:hypothetical protein
LPKPALLSEEIKTKIQFHMSEQQKLLLAEPGKLISLTQAATATPYSAEYLSLLARKGRIPAIKISRDWLTTRQAVLLYVNTQRKKHQELLNRFGRSGRRVE